MLICIPARIVLFAVVSLKQPREQAKQHTWKGTASRREAYYAGATAIEHVKSVTTSGDGGQGGDAVEMKQRVKDAIRRSTLSRIAETVLKQLLEVTVPNDGPEEYGHQVSHFLDLTTLYLIGDHV